MPAWIREQPKITEEERLIEQRGRETLTWMKYNRLNCDQWKAIGVNDKIKEYVIEGFTGKTWEEDRCHDFHGLLWKLLAAWQSS